MFYPVLRPRITEYAQVSKLVSYLRREGVAESQLAQRVSEIGAVDLDILQMVLLAD